MFPFPPVNLSAIPWDFVLILVVLGVIVPWRGAARIRRLLAQPELSSSQRFSVYASTITFQWLIVAVIFWRCSSRGLSRHELGLVVASFWQTLLLAVVFTALLGVNQWAGLRRIARIPVDRRGFAFRFTEKLMPKTPTERLAFLALACTAGLSEEFIYRGFVFAIFSRLFVGLMVGSSLSIIISSAWFAVAHLYQGRRGIITTFVVGCLFATLRIWCGNLVPAITGHIGVDLIAGLYGPRVLRNLSHGVSTAPVEAPPENSN